MTTSTDGLDLLRRTLKQISTVGGDADALSRRAAATRLAGTSITSQANAAAGVQD